jgi:hypothetical protein
MQDIYVLILNYYSHTETLIFIIYSKTYLAPPGRHPRQKSFCFQLASLARRGRQYLLVGLRRFIFSPMTRCVPLTVLVCPFLILFALTHSLSFATSLLLFASKTAPFICFDSGILRRRGEFPAVSKLVSKDAVFFILFYSNLHLFSLFIDSSINQCGGVIIAGTAAL